MERKKIKTEKADLDKEVVKVTLENAAKNKVIIVDDFIDLEVGEQVDIVITNSQTKLTDVVAEKFKGKKKNK